MSGSKLDNTTDTQNISIRTDIYTSLTFNVKASDNSNDVYATFYDVNDKGLVSSDSETDRLTIQSKGSSKGNPGFIKSTVGNLILSTTGNGDLTLTTTGKTIVNTDSSIFLYISEVGKTPIKSRILVYNPITSLGKIEGDSQVVSGHSKDLSISLGNCSTRNKDVTQYSGTTDSDPKGGSNGSTTDIIEWSSQEKANFKTKGTISGGNYTATYTAPSSFSGIDTITAKRVSAADKDKADTDISAFIDTKVNETTFVITINESHPATQLKFENGGKFNIESGKTLGLNSNDRLKVTTVNGSQSTDILTWSSSNPQVATVNDSGEVTARSAGTAVITVKGETPGVETSCNVEVYVKADTLALMRIDGKEIINLNKRVGGHETISVKESLSTNKNVRPTESIKAESSDESILTVTHEQIKEADVRNFDITIKKDADLKKVKTVTVTFSTDRTEGTDTKAELRVDVYPKVSDDTDIKFRNKSNGQIIDDEKGTDAWIGDKDGLSIQADSTSDNDALNDEFTWSAGGTEGDKASSENDLDTLKIISAKKGDIEYTATSVSNEKVSKKVKVHVKQPAESLKINQSPFVINVGDSRELTTTVLPEDNDEKVTWTSSAEDYLSVDQNGKVTALQPYTGDVVITAKAGHSGLSDTCKVNIVKASNIKIEGRSITGGVIEGKDSVTAGANLDTDYINAIVKNEEGTDYNKFTTRWESDDPDIVSVVPDADDASKAVLTYHKAGTAKVTAKVGEGEVSDTITVVVKADIKKAQVSGLSLDGSENTFSYLPGGEHPDFKVTLSYGNDKRSKNDEYTLEEGESSDYTVTDTYDNKTGRYTYTIEGKGIYNGTQVLTYTVSKIDLSSSDGQIVKDKDGNGVLKVVDSNKKDAGTITFKSHDVIYNGKAQTPDFNAVFEKDGKTENLTIAAGSGSDSDIRIDSWKNNTNAYTEPSVTFRGIGNFTGTAAFENAFDIRPYEISTLENDKIDPVMYTGKEITPAPVLYRTNGVSSDGEAVNEKISNNEVVINYINNLRSGTASVVVGPKETESNYSGTKTIKFEITKAPLGDVSVSRISDLTFTGLPLTPIPEVTYKGVKVDNASEFKVEYGNNLNISAETSAVATLTAVSGGDFTGFKKGITFRISKKKLSDEDIEIAPIEDQNYTQSAMEPDLTVTNTSNGVALIKGVDYTARYTNNVDRNSADAEESRRPTVEITGIGNYSGTKKAYFSIVTKDKSVKTADSVVIGTEKSEVKEYVPKDYTEACLKGDTVYMDQGETKALHLTLKSGGEKSDDIMYTQKGSQDDANLNLEIKGLKGGDDGILLIKANRAGASTFTINSFGGTLNKKITVIAYNKAKEFKIQSNDENVKTDSSAASFTMIQNHTGQFKTNLGTTPYDDTVSWSVDREDLAEINENGLLTAKKEGTLNIIATVNSRENDKRGLTYMAMLHITQNTPATSIKFDNTSYDLKNGQKLSIKAEVLPENNTEQLVWRSSDETVATVDESGNVSGLKEGNTVISCSSFDGKVKAEAKVTVYEEGNSVTLDKTEDSLYIGDKLTLKASVLPETAEDYFTWEVTDKDTGKADAGNIVKIDVPGQTEAANSQEVEITAAAKGTVLITVKSSRTGRTASATITVKKAIESITLDKTELSMEEGKSDKLTAVISPDDASDQAVWSSDNEKIAKVDNDGRVNAVSEGTAVITCKAPNDETKAECKVTVTKKATPTPVPTPTAKPVTTSTPKPTSSPKATSSPKTSASPEASGKPGSAASKGGKKKPGAVKKVTVRKSGRYAVITWSKAGKAGGYQIAYSNSPKFVRARRRYTKGRTFKIRRGRRAYYLRVRAYSLSGGKKVFGRWSARKRV